LNYYIDQTPLRFLLEKNTKLIRTAGPSITKKEIEYVNDAVTNGWNENWNNYILKFEKKCQNILV
jgi:dTDP-4-amino-4,6-dideoxygalactose transaminase